MLLNEFREKANNMSMKFSYYLVEDREKFQLIDVNELEKRSLIIYGSNYPESIHQMKKEKKFQTEINTNDK